MLWLSSLWTISLAISLALRIIRSFLTWPRIMKGVLWVRIVSGSRLSLFIVVCVCGPSWWTDMYSNQGWSALLRCGPENTSVDSSASTDVSERAILTLEAIKNAEEPGELSKAVWVHRVTWYWSRMILRAPCSCHLICRSYVLRLVLPTFMTL